jgi:hypothetical protein
LAVGEGNAIGKRAEAEVDEVVRRREGADLSWLGVITLPILFETVRDARWVECE